MRKFIVTEKLIGKIIINNKYEFDNVKGEYQYDIYSNSYFKGSVKINNFLSSIKSIQEIDKFEFNGNGLTIFGQVTKIKFGETEIIDFSIDELIQWIKYSNELPTMVHINYYIPYISALSRSLKYHYPDDNHILNFSSEEFKINVHGLSIIFFEKINVIEYKEPDKILNRLLFPQIKIVLCKNDEIIDKLNFCEILFHETMRILSLLLFKRLYSFGYKADILGENNRLIQKFIYKSTKKQSTQDYLLENGHNFNKFFNTDNISKIIESLLHLEKTKKEKYIRVLNAYLTIGELKIFEPQFKDAYFALEAISKLIVKPSGKISSENLISEACNQAEIDIFKITFKSATKSKKLKWLISEYRNELTHFNFETHFEMNDLVKEFSKIMKLLRMLIIYYLVPQLKDFPYPKDNYKFLMNYLFSQK